ncbi:hypothetical protein [Actinopolymorpha alba]|uniref:hypothetical protein n=1 Tax=Actinopolymorpha alba TaxID=533267 RepID=UPI0003647FE8|nr:hypothetical protein [Actinopolymorpha alba]
MSQVGPNNTVTAKALTLISQWLAGTDHAELAASFHRFIGAEDYNTTQLRNDLARFTFLLRHDDGEQLFGRANPDSPNPVLGAAPSVSSAHTRQNTARVASTVRFRPRCLRIFADHLCETPLVTARSLPARTRAADLWGSACEIGPVVDELMEMIG